ncbi:glycosyltransferase, partial [Bacillus circulans]|uniref:glycosyltransferase n=1 Tax=Niallia circulans TaxID=1397 RepID=UPI00155FF30D
KNIINNYKKYNPKTVFIPYGADIEKSSIEDTEFLNKWYSKNSISVNNYYLIVGRFVPENNYELMIREFMMSNTKKDLVIITNIQQNEFYNQLKTKTNFDKDNRIKFVGTLYDSNLLKRVRENAYAYLHGHEVGGTNPSLLEAMAATKINVLLDVIFNSEVGMDGALYFSKKNGSLSKLINN